jgi:hypothetical protein
MTPIGVILFEKSVERIPEARKRFPDSDSGETCEKWPFSLQNPKFIFESGSGKHFQGSGMRAIVSSHKITLIGVI